MSQQPELGQSIVEFLLETPEGRAALSAVLTGVIGGAIRLLFQLSEHHLLDRHEILRLERQQQLEAELDRLRQRMLELGIAIEEEENDV